MTAAQAQSSTYRVLRPLGARAAGTEAALRGAQDLFVVQRFAECDADQVEREARCLAKNWHPNVARVRHVEALNGELVVATDFLDGMTLDDLVRAAAAKRGSKEPPIAAPVAGRILLDVLSGLQNIHGMRDDALPLAAAHGAICPTNIVVGKDGVARLIATFRQRLPGVDANAENVGHAAPEVLEGVLPDARSDLFGCGVTLWELLQGRALYPGNKSDVLHAQRESEISWSTAPISAALLLTRVKPVVLKALAFDPALRFKSANELATALRVALGKDIATGSTVAQLVIELGNDRIRARRFELDPRGPAKDSGKIPAVRLPAIAVVPDVPVEPVATAREALASSEPFDKSPSARDVPASPIAQPITREVPITPRPAIASAREAAKGEASPPPPPLAPATPRVEPNRPRVPEQARSSPAKVKAAAPLPVTAPMAAAPVTTPATAKLPAAGPAVVAKTQPLAKAPPVNREAVLKAIEPKGRGQTAPLPQVPKSPPAAKAAPPPPTLASPARPPVEATPTLQSKAAAPPPPNVVEVEQDALTEDALTEDALTEEAATTVTPPLSTPPLSTPLSLGENVDDEEVTAATANEATSPTSPLVMATAPLLAAAPPPLPPPPPTLESPVVASPRPAAVAPTLESPAATPEPPQVVTVPMPMAPPRGPLVPPPVATPFPVEVPLTTSRRPPPMTSEPPPFLRRGIPVKRALAIVIAAILMTLVVIVLVFRGHDEEKPQAAKPPPPSTVIQPPPPAVTATPSAPTGEPASPPAKAPEPASAPATAAVVPAPPAPTVLPAPRPAAPPTVTPPPRPTYAAPAPAGKPKPVRPPYQPLGI